MPAADWGGPAGGETHGQDACMYVCMLNAGSKGKLTTGTWPGGKKDAVGCMWYLL
jgi:hypothetical protein